MPDAWQARVPALRARLEVEMKRIADARKRFDTPPCLPMDETWEQWIEQQRDALESLGYL